MRRLTLMAVALVLVACDRSKPELEKTLVQVQQISAEKDSLMRDVSATTQFIVDLNTEIAKVRPVNGHPPVNVRRGETDDNMSPADRRADVLQKVKDMTARLNASEARLDASRKRMAAITGKNGTMSAELAAYDSTMASFKGIIENQKTQIADLGKQVETLTSENTQLKTDNVQLVSDKAELTTERNTVYYIVGTKDSLLQQHIIEQTGGIIGLGKVAVPARELNPSAFTPIDKTQVSEITFPKANTPYRIITRQDWSALETVPDKHGTLVNTMKIKDPDAFWATSKYLILVER